MSLSCRQKILVVTLRLSIECDTERLTIIVILRLKDYMLVIFEIFLFQYFL